MHFLAVNAVNARGLAMEEEARKEAMEVVKNAVPRLVLSSERINAGSRFRLKELPKKKIGLKIEKDWFDYASRTGPFFSVSPQYISFSVHDKASAQDIRGFISETRMYADNSSLLVSTR